VSNLKNQISGMQREIDGLKMLVGDFLLKEQPQVPDEQFSSLTPQFPAKQMKFSPPTDNSRSSDLHLEEAVPDPPTSSGLTVTTPSSDKEITPPLPSPASFQSRSNSLGLASFTSHDEEILNSLFMDETLPDVPLDTLIAE